MTVLLVGYGFWGANVARAFRAAGHRVLAVDPDPKACARAERDGFGYIFRTADELPQVLAEGQTDAVAVCSPPDTHETWIRAGLAAGRHVWTEKPIAGDAHATAAVIEAARAAHRVLFVDHTFAFAPAVVALRAVLPPGLRHVQGSRTHLCRPRDGADVIGDLLPHDLSILAACGQEAEAVSAHAGPSDAHVLLCLPDGARASLYLSWASAIKTRRMAFHASAETVVYDHLDPRMPITVYRAHGEGSRRAFTYGDAICPEVPADEPLARAVEAFSAMVAEREPDNADGALRIQRVVDAARLSEIRESWETVTP